MFARHTGRPFESLTVELITMHWLLSEALGTVGFCGATTTVGEAVAWS
jgi:hypothetical protein